MMRQIVHRGPDGPGMYLDERAAIALAHLRLAIVDPAADGAQPMRSHCSRYLISINGEIFIFRQIRRELEKHSARFSGHIDRPECGCRDADDECRVLRESDRTASRRRHP
jgi:asparagine synthase (glutamine-hydrolysing)